ncbi:hypothetical protein HanXRQr2_Chr15g0693211 [Helianthus annuus]|uniref:Uncharacterized protein n=1 Tax=Helianthus annuus TaxID=4232 RepID=A0A9K3E1I6_HELAN|nr:hypothetical protein HanXRQr2_Chr15g0693211 [Helianthus annuus]KAJ0831269.1 hypothetical protein HanPSC8_Chr15g0665121 [Helianthus annuus]
MDLPFQQPIHNHSLIILLHRTFLRRLDHHIIRSPTVVAIILPARVKRAHQ